MDKNLWKFFIFLFLVNFIIINWSDVSWLFNYKFISQGLVSLFERVGTEAAKNELLTLEITEELKDSPYLKDNNLEFVVVQGNILKIPRIGVEAPLIFPEDNTQAAFQEALNKGVFIYPQSALPGKDGMTIILGHSAPASWPKIRYYHIFNNLEKLDSGDLIYVYFNQRQYVFEVRKKMFLSKGEEIPGQDLTFNEQSYIILLSCWPPATGQKRIAIEGELVN